MKYSPLERNKSRRRFLKTAGRAGTACVAVTALGFRTAAADPAVGTTWSESHSYVEQQYAAWGGNWTEWFAFDHAVGLRYHGKKTFGNDTVFSVSVVGLHVVRYNNDYGISSEYRKSLSSMELGYRGLDGTEHTGPDNTSNTSVTAGPPESKRTVVNNTDLSETELNDPNAVFQTRKFRHTQGDWLKFLEAAAAAASTFGVGSISTIGTYVSAATLAFGLVDAMNPPDDDRTYADDGNLYRWNAPDWPRHAAGVSHIEELYLYPDDYGVATLEVHLGTTGETVVGDLGRRGYEHEYESTLVITDYDHRLARS